MGQATLGDTKQLRSIGERSGEPMQDSFNNGRQVTHQGCTTVNEYLQNALAEREQLLARQPHLRAYQAEIDRILDKSGDSKGRMAVLETLMQGKLLDIQRELYKLTKILRQAVNSR